MLDIDATITRGTNRILARFKACNGVTALFGQSGAGKSTMIDMIAGLVRPDTGIIRFGETVFFDETNRTNLPTRKRQIGYVFQESRLFPHLSVSRNLTYARWAGKRKRDRDFDEVVELLGLGELLDRRPTTLSGGERQRVAIGRALLSAPRLLLMDEPLASLDGARKAEILPYLERLRTEARVPIVYVSHTMDEITRLADDLVVVSEGSVVAHGPIADILGRIDLGPATGRHEAGSVLEGVIRERDGAFGLTGVRVGVERFLVPGIEAPLGTPVRLRIRARDVAIALERPTGISIQNVVPATVLEISRPQGAYVEIVLAVGAQRLRSRITARAAAALKLAPSLTVYALVKAIAIDRKSVGPLQTPN